MEFAHLHEITKKQLMSMARRFAHSITIHVDIVNTLKASLRREMYKDNISLQRQRIRGDCYSRYMNLEKHFTKIGVLGRGSFGEVSLVVRKDNSSKFYALKQIKFSKDPKTATKFSLLAIERDAMLHLASDHIVALKAAWIESGHLDKPDAAFLLCEFMARGTLTDLIMQFHPMAVTETDLKGFSGRCNALLNENSDYGEFLDFLVVDEVKIVRSSEELKRKYMNAFMRYTDSIIEMVNFIHNRDVVHRDLKPDNILVTADLRLKLGDLGLVAAFKRSHYVQQFEWMQEKILTDYVFMDLPTQTAILDLYRNAQMRLRKTAGTTLYTPPECLGVNTADWRVLTNNVGVRRYLRHRHFKHDWWSVGCILYSIYTGVHPFMGAVLKRWKEYSFDNLLRMVCRPTSYCGLLYQLPREEGPEPFIVEPRLLHLVRRLTAVDFADRATGEELRNDAAYQQLLEDFMTGPEPGWEWNEFRDEPRASRGLEMSRRYRERGDAHSGQEEQGAARGVRAETPRREFGRIPDAHGFAMMDVSPGVVASPEESPLTRFNRLRRGQEPPSPRPFP